MLKLLESLIEAARELVSASDHLEGCPERGKPDAPGCPCGYAEKREAVLKVTKEARASIEVYTQ